MVAQLSPSLWVFVVGLVTAAIGTLVLAVYIIKNDIEERPYQAFTVLLLAVVVWTTGQLGRLLAVSLEMKLGWQLGMYVGIVTAPVAWLVFVLLYTGRRQYVDRGRVALLLIVPVLSLVALATNDVHHLFYADVEIVSVGPTPILSTVAGPIWWVSFAYSYLLIGIGIVVLVRFALTSEKLYRVQVLALLLASVLPLIANGVFVFGLLSDPVVDLTPLTFSLSTLFLFISVFYGRFLDVVPVGYETLVRTLSDGILVVDETGQIVSANPAAQEMMGQNRSDGALTGRQLSAVEPTLATTDTESPPTVSRSVTTGFEVSASVGAETKWYWVREIELPASTTGAGSVLTVTDITEKKGFERRLRKLEQTHRDLIVADDEDEITRIAIESTQDVLGLPITGLWKAADDQERLDPVGMSDEAERLFDDQPTFRPGESIVWESFSAGELRTYSDLSAVPNVHNPGTPLGSELIVPIGTWGVLVSGSTSQTEFEDVDFDLLRLLSAGLERALQRHKRERAIRRLQERTSTLIREQSPETIARKAVETADEVFDLPLSGIHLLSADETVLEATAVTDTVRDEFGSAPTYRRNSDSSVDEAVWQVYDTDQTLVVEDVRNSQIDLDASPVRSVIAQSLPGHGVFITSSPQSEAFDESDLALAELFATTVTATLDRVERERQLRARERELSRQNERLEEFTSVVSHDLKSPLNQVDIYLDLLDDEYDDDRLRAAIDATDRATELVDDLLRLARQGKTVEDPEPGDLTATVEAAWESIPAAETTLHVEDDLGRVVADHARVREAVENLLRNSVEHGGAVVRIGRLDDESGCYVADDGPGIPAEMREDVFDHGYTTAQSGTGFGLAIVERIVEAHNWTITAGESADGGARFEISGMERADSERDADSQRDADGESLP